MGQRGVGIRVASHSIRAVLQRPQTFHDWERLQNVRLARCDKPRRRRHGRIRVGKYGEKYAGSDSTREQRTRWRCASRPMSYPVKSFKAEPLTIASTTVPSGVRARTQLDLIELADGAKVRVPVVIINGSNPGPRIYLGAAIHGDEVNGVAILSQALGDLDPT